MMLSVKKVLIVCYDLLCFGLLLVMPERQFSAACILLADLFVLFLIAGQLRNGLRDPAACLLGLTYFLFLLSGATFSLMKGIPVFDYLEREISAVNHGCLMVLLGIACLTTIHILVEDVEIRLIAKNRGPSSASSPTALQKLAVLLLFLLTVGCKLLIVLETLTVSRTAGYHALFTQQTSSLPTLIHHIAALFYFSLTMFLACRFPTTITMAAFVAMAALSACLLIAGDRTEAVCGILLLVCYTICRCREEPTFFRRRKAVAVLLLLCMPALLYLLQAVTYVRIGAAVPSQYLEQVMDFFHDQGVSLKIPVDAVSLKEPLQQQVSRSFIWGQIRAYAEQNALSRALFHIPKVSENTMEMARSGYCYGSAMSYLLMRDSYLRGIGSGTCFLAELYHDFSWSGVIIGSALMALFLRTWNNLPQKGWIPFALYLNGIRTLLMLPRGACLRWFTETLSVPNLMLLALILFLGFVSRPKSRLTGENDDETTNDPLRQRISL